MKVLQHKDTKLSNFFIFFLLLFKNRELFLNLQTDLFRRHNCLVVCKTDPDIKFYQNLTAMRPLEILLTHINMQLYYFSI